METELEQLFERKELPKGFIEPWDDARETWVLHLHNNLPVKRHIDDIYDRFVIENVFSIQEYADAIVFDFAVAYRDGLEVASQYAIRRSSIHDYYQADSNGQLIGIHRSVSSKICPEPFNE